MYGECHSGIKGESEMKFGNQSVVVASVAMCSIALFAAPSYGDDGESLGASGAPVSSEGSAKTVREVQPPPPGLNDAYQSIM